MGSDQSPETTTTYRSTSFIIIKWCVVVLIVLNIVSSVWVGIYMSDKIERIQNMDEFNTELDIIQRQGHNYKRKAEVWKGVIITVLVITDLICLLGAFGVIREHYCLTMIFGVLILMYGIFCAAVHYTRGSISGWVISFTTGLITCLFGHKIRVEVIRPTIYSSPIID